MTDRRGVMLVHGDHRWIIIFDDSQRPEACSQIGRWAADPRLPFTWTQAAELAWAINYPEGESEQ